MLLPLCLVLLAGLVRCEEKSVASVEAITRARTSSIPFTYSDQGLTNTEPIFWCWRILRCFVCGFLEPYNITFIGYFNMFLYKKLTSMYCICFLKITIRYSFKLMHILLFKYFNIFAFQITFFKIQNILKNFYHIF